MQQIFYVSILFPFILPFYFLTTTMDIDSGISRKLPTMTEEKDIEVNKEEKIERRRKN